MLLVSLYVVRPFLLVACLHQRGIFSEMDDVKIQKVGTTPAAIVPCKQRSKNTVDGIPMIRTRSLLRRTIATSRIGVLFVWLVVVLTFCPFKPWQWRQLRGPSHGVMANSILDGSHPELYYVDSESSKDELILRYEPNFDSPYHPTKVYEKRARQQQRQHQEQQRHRRQQNNHRSTSKHETGGENSNYRDHLSNTVLILHGEVLPYHEFRTTPRYFWGLTEQEVLQEVHYHIIHGRWSDRVLLEKLYFGLLYGLSGLPDDIPHPQRGAGESSNNGNGKSYSATKSNTNRGGTTINTSGRKTTPLSKNSATATSSSVNNEMLKSAHGWDIYERTSNYCEWEGIECSQVNNTSGIATAPSTTDRVNNDDSFSTSIPETTSSHLPLASVQPSFTVTEIRLASYALKGTLPHDLYLLSDLRHLDLKGNFLHGTIPHTYGKMTKLTSLCLAVNHLSGTIPSELGLLRPTLQHLWLSKNRLSGVFPQFWFNGENDSAESWQKGHDLGSGDVVEELEGNDEIDVGGESSSTEHLNGTMSSPWPRLALLDVSSNRLSGRIPNFGPSNTPQLINLFFENNQFTGSLPTVAIPAMTNELPLDHRRDTSSGKTQSDDPDDGLDDGKMSSMLSKAFRNLQVVDFGSNKLRGTIPTSWFSLPKLRDFNIAGNKISGSIPSQLLSCTTLEVLVLSDNEITGEIPRGDDIIPGKGRTRLDAPVGGQWSDLTNLQLVMLNNNNLHGILPPEMFYGLRDSLNRLDIAYNDLEGPVPPEIGTMSKLKRLDAMGNRLAGSLPDEMNNMNPNLELNFTNNLLVGTVPNIFCGAGFLSMNLLYRLHGCDAVLCPAGTFHPTGAATLQAGCRPCPINWEDDEDRRTNVARVLGRTQCPQVQFVHGDLNGDGKLSSREVLLLLFVETIGRNWGAQFQSWGDMRTNECDLNGVTCVSGEVAKIDLTDAALCSNGERKAGPPNECHGLPAELSLLTGLEVLTLNRRQFLRGTIFSEMGKLTKLKYLDISSCPSMGGNIPSELGKLTNLKYLNLGGCRFNGTIPIELFQLSGLERLHLSMNPITGPLASSVGNLVKVKELMLSRTQLSGTIPTEIGLLTSLENLEIYGNRLVGSIPEELGNCTSLKRIDLFNNKLSGTLPETLSQLQNLQILHAKLNDLSGTISSSFGELPVLSWFDVSSNRFHGTIPSTFGTSNSIKDFRLGNNMIFDPIPQSLCVNTNINGGLTRNYGCDGVICPLGTFSDPGHATHSAGCTPCPEGQTTMYLGSSSCDEFSHQDMLTVFFEVLRGEKWNAAQRLGWNDDSVDVCDWKGVYCDDHGEILSLRIPLAGLHYDQFNVV